MFIVKLVVEVARTLQHSINVIKMINYNFTLRIGLNGVLQQKRDGSFDKEDLGWIFVYLIKGLKTQFITTSKERSKILEDLSNDRFDFYYKTLDIGLEVLPGFQKNYTFSNVPEEKSCVLVTRASAKVAKLGDLLESFSGFDTFLFAFFVSLVLGSCGLLIILSKQVSTSNSFEKLSRWFIWLLGSFYGQTWPESSLSDSPIARIVITVLVFCVFLIHTAYLSLFTTDVLTYVRESPTLDNIEQLENWKADTIHFGNGECADRLENRHKRSYLPLIHHGANVAYLPSNVWSKLGLMIKSEPGQKILPESSHSRETLKICTCFAKYKQLFEKTPIQSSQPYDIWFDYIPHRFGMRKKKIQFIQRLIYANFENGLISASLRKHEIRDIVVFFKLTSCFYDDKQEQPSFLALKIWAYKKLLMIYAGHFIVASITLIAIEMPFLLKLVKLFNE